MLLRQQPQFEWETRGIRRNRNELIVFANNAHAGFHLLPDHVAENAALFLSVVMLRRVQFLAHSLGYDRERDQLRVRVLQRRTRRISMILEDESVAKPLVILEIQHAIAISPQHVLDRANRQ